MSTRAASVRALPLPRPRVALPALAPRRRTTSKTTTRPKPKLKVVELDHRAIRERRTRRLMWCFGIVSVVSLFTVVVFHVMLAQSQFGLDRVAKQTTLEQRRYEQLRERVAELASPQRIVSSALDRLGMVQPIETTYLTPPPGVGVGDVSPSDSTASTLAKGWAEVKPNLDPQP